MIGNLKKLSHQQLSTTSRPRYWIALTVLWVLSVTKTTTALRRWTLRPNEKRSHGIGGSICFSNPWLQFSMHPFDPYSLKPESKYCHCLDCSNWLICSNHAYFPEQENRIACWQTLDTSPLLYSVPCFSKVALVWIWSHSINVYSHCLSSPYVSL